ncbi:hypothetical protein IAT38_000534 [Cryptococcus sp. DSM 104549]
MPRPDNPQRPVFVAETDDVRSFARLLRGIGLKNSATLELAISQDPSQPIMSVSVDDAHTITATAWIPPSVFTKWSAVPQGVEDIPPAFDFSLDTLLTCLNIFGNAYSGSSSSNYSMGGKGKSRWAGDGDATIAGEDGSDRLWAHDKKGAGATSMRMEWMGHGHELTLLLRDESKGSKGPTTTCALKTLEPTEIAKDSFDRENMVLHIIMKSEWFRDALQDLPTSCSRITLIATPPRSGSPGGARAGNGDMASQHAQRRPREVGQFSIHAEGDFGSVELDYPNDREVMETFQCQVEEGVTFSYHAAHINHLTRALQNSVKTSIQIDWEGVLCVQMLVQDGKDIGSHNGLVEFSLQPLEEEV